MSMLHLPAALDRLELALSDLPDGPVRHDLEHALAIARFDADGPGEAAPLLGAVEHAVSELEPGPLKDALEDVYRALLAEADTAAFADAHLTSAVYLRAAGYVDRAARALTPLAAQTS